MSPNIKRIHLLSEAEIADLYARPDFNHSEKKIYFTLNACELDALNQYSNTRTRVYFILQLGYFKAKQQFFKFKFEDVRTDVEYILFNFFNSTDSALSGQISRNYINQQRGNILHLLSYQDWSSKYKPQIEVHICKLLRYYPKGHSALRQLLIHFNNQQIVIPVLSILSPFCIFSINAPCLHVAATNNSLKLLILDAINPRRSARVLFFIRKLCRIWGLRSNGTENRVKS